MLNVLRTLNGRRTPPLRLAYQLLTSANESDLLTSARTIFEPDQPPLGNLWRIQGDPLLPIRRIEKIASLDGQSAHLQIRPDQHEHYAIWSNTPTLSTLHTANNTTQLLMGLATEKGWQGLLEFSWPYLKTISRRQRQELQEWQPLLAAALETHSTRLANSRLQEAYVRQARDMNIIVGIAANVGYVLSDRKSTELLSDIATAAAMAFHLEITGYLKTDEAALNRILLSSKAYGGPPLISLTSDDPIAIAYRDRRITESHSNSVHRPTSAIELAIPMLLGETPIGVLAFQDIDSHGFGDAEKSVLLSLTGMITVAYENARLYEQQAHNARTMRQLSDTKTAFLSTMSHELRTPLSQIIGYCELIMIMLGRASASIALDLSDLDPMLAAELLSMEEPAAPNIAPAIIEQAEHIVNRLKANQLSNTDAITDLLSLLGMSMDTLLRDIGYVREGGLNLMDLIDDLLNIAKIEAGYVELFAQTFSIQGVLDELNVIALAIAHRTHKQHISFSSELAADLPDQMTADRGKLIQIISNLITNSYKFTEHGFIELSFRRLSASHLRIAVSDSGIGIPADQHQRIFDSFVQGDQSTTREYEGSGLGLAISRAITIHMGGSINLSSEVGQGSTFNLDLPIIHEDS